MTAMAPAASRLRAFYRNFLRELPARQPNILANPSSVQRHIRADLESPSSKTTIAEAEQYLQYIQSQRVYATLVERYNPGMNMADEERVRLTARRVGMNLPVESDHDTKDK